ncbi:MAG: DUF885 domain-containing protein [Planctomycetota bacterium]|jgi:uncharacterized protein (DUF885 family)
MKKYLKYILGLLGLVLLVGGWWTYKLVWGKPLNINHFYERVFIEYLLDDPEQLSRLGFIDNTLLDFHSDDLTDASPARAQKLAKKARRDLELLRSYKRDKQTESQRLSTDILEWFLDNVVGGEVFMYHNYPVNQLSGVQNDLPTFMDAVHQVRNEKSAANYIARLSKFGIKFNQVMKWLKLQENKGIIPPKFVVEKALIEMRNFVDQPVDENILFTSLKQKLVRIRNLDEQKKEKIYGDARKEIEQTVYPAYQKLITYFEGLTAKTTTEDGVWKLPNGNAYYVHILRRNTTLDYTPEEVHQIGLSEVDRIHNEMRRILDCLGYKGKTVAEHMHLLAEEGRFLYPDTDSGRAQILNDYQKIIDEIEQGLSEVFNLRPKAHVKVERIPEFKEKTSPIGYYNPPAMDGSRPGVFYANLRDVKEIPKFGMRNLVYHEAVPGHHFQRTIQQEIKGVPTFRKVIPFTAYIEGWALYAERLAWEYGFHKYPYSNLGRLQGELLRAVRLVVDTGIHYKKWTREQAIEYMLANTGMSEGDTVAEIERYIVNPGQACAYKIGMLKILELREKTEQQLGDHFDIREFHDVVLKNGAMPLSVLEQVLDTYLKSKTPP